MLSSKPRVKHGYVVDTAEGFEISHETDALLTITDSLNEKREFRLWLHIWTVFADNSRAKGHVERHTAQPWVRLWEKPDLSLMMATYHITDFVNFPVSWETFWYDLDDMVEARRNNQSLHGPYWMLLPVPSIARLAAEMASVKRRLVNEHFKAACCNKFLHEGEFVRALEPFRVFSPQQELEDEIARVAEERSGSVRIWDGAPSNRTPRCR